MTASTPRDRILSRLRTTLAREELRFPPRDPEPLLPEARMSVTAAAGGAPELIALFRSRLAALHGTSEYTSTPAAARLALINRLMAWHDEENGAVKGARPVTGQEKMVLSWGADALPVEYLAESLADIGFTLVAPETLFTKEDRENVRHIRYGLTGVEAAFATTASILVASARDQARSASLLPHRHLALIPVTRLFATMEAWMAEFAMGDLDRYVRAHANLTLISGPSSSGDIEMRLTLGVHGPRHLHVILFDDIPPDDIPSDVIPSGAIPFGDIPYDDISSGDIPHGGAPSEQEPPWQPLLS